MISIIIPTYNEAKNITDLICRIKKCLSESYEIIVVDDGSPDGTSSVAQKLSSEHPVRVIDRKQKLGLASAVLAGFNVARGDLFCVMDSDLSHPPELIPVLASNLRSQEADLVVASRFAKGGGIENWPKERLMATRTAMLTVRLLTSIKDPMSGFFILKKGVVYNVELIPRGFKILLEILVKGKYKKAVEIPFIFKDRIYGSSKLDLKVYTEYIVQLCDLYLYRIKKLLHIKSA